MSRFSPKSIQKGLLILSLLIAGTMIYAAYTHPAQAQAGGTYQFVMTFPASGVDSAENEEDIGPPCKNASTPAAFSCNASTVGQYYDTITCTGNSTIAYAHDFLCTYTPPPAPVCTPDSSCAANTCTTTTCNGIDANCNTTTLQGTKDCTVGCTATNSCQSQTNTGVMVNGVCSAPVPSESLCPQPPPPTCTNGSFGPYPSCPTTCTNGSVGSYPSCPTTCSNGSVGPYPSCPTTCSNGSAGPYPSCPLPPSCTPNDCAANTCNVAPNNTCVDSCGNTVLGTNPAKCVASPPTGCTNPSVSIIANPARVTSGKTTTLSVGGTGLNGPCTVVGPGVNQAISANACSVATTTITTPAITTQTTYRVTCAADGSTASTAIVNVAASFKLY